MSRANQYLHWHFPTHAMSQPPTNVNAFSEASSVCPLVVDLLTPEQVAKTRTTTINRCVKFVWVDTCFLINITSSGKSSYALTALVQERVSLSVYDVLQLDDYGVLHPIGIEVEMVN